jgi:putative ABC transport system permease protein
LRKNITIYLSDKLINNIMLSFLKLFFRNALRNKTFTSLNILGLAIGMASFIIIMLWVKDELSYDKYNVNAERIYRMNFFTRFNGISGISSYCPGPLSAALKNDYPEIEKTVRFQSNGNAIIKYNNTSFTEYEIVYADSTVFGIFTIPIIKGNAKTALTAPFTIAVSESMAKKYFGDEDPINKILKFDNKTDYRVTAVYKDIPKASHFHFNFIASLYSTNEYKQDIWLNNNFHTYFLLKKNTDPIAFEKKLPQLIDRYFAPQAASALGTTWEKLLETGILIKFSIQNVRDIHLNTDISGGFDAGGDIKYVYIFILIAVFIILLACINFTNLSTARSATRLKDVGIRKVFGVQRSKLSMQFMLESFLIVFAAYIVAMVLTEISIPFFNRLTEKSLLINYFDIGFIGAVFCLVFVISVLAGSYPAVYLSSFMPIAVLKGEMVTGSKKTRFRSILVVGQFTISLILLSSVLILNRQMNFIQEKNLGFNKEQLLVINNTNLLEKNIENFKNQLISNPQILAFTESGFLPSPSSRNNGSVWRDGVMSNDPVGFTHFFVDYDYIKTFDMKILSGRGFSKEFSTDSSAIVINQAAAKQLGWKDPVGRKIGDILRSDFDINKPVLDIYTIIGVVEDFNYQSLHNSVGALAMYLKESNQMITCRIRRGTNISEMVAFLKSKWVENAPDQPFEYDFVADSLHRQYSGESRLGKILGIFTGLAFFVSCLGLFGLALFASEQRKKEIGLRKVNGSGIGQIVWMLSSDFTKLILISFVIACPVTYYLMDKWLQNFSYRANISIWIFVAAMLLTNFIALATIGYQSYKAATTNPVNTLRAD